MGNKYSKWLDGTQFNNSVRLRRRYDNIDTTPMCTPMVRYEYKKNIISKPGRFEGELNELQKKILSLVTFHGFLSSKQIQTFLELQGMEVSMSEITRTLEYLIYYNLVERNTVIRRETTYNREKLQYVNTNCEGVKLYSQGVFKPFERTNFPSCPLKNLSILKQESGNAIPSLAISMHIVNQILLNNMIYADNVQRFRIAQIKYLPGMRLVVPLEIVTENRTYYFVNSLFLTAYRLQEVLSNWGDYSARLQGKDSNSEIYTKKHNRNGELPQRKYERFTLVIIAVSNVHLMQVMDIVNKADIEDFDIAFTVYDDWFQPRKGNFFLREAIR